MGLVVGTIDPVQRGYGFDTRWLNWHIEIVPKSPSAQIVYGADMKPAQVSFCESS